LFLYDVTFTFDNEGHATSCDLFLVFVLNNILFSLAVAKKSYGEYCELIPMRYKYRKLFK